MSCSRCEAPAWSIKKEMVTINLNKRDRQFIMKKQNPGNIELTQISTRYFSERQVRNYSV